MAKKLTPMMQQYMDMKDQYKDCILFYRLGDFYEMFFDDALTASRELEITLTGRECGQEEKAPMCGVPHHAAENYINKLIAKGYKVAICEQVEDPAQAKGIVKRDVVRIVTPGTNLNIQSLNEDKNNYLMALYSNKDDFGVAYVDITTGAFYTTEIQSEHKLLDEIAKIQPTEIILNQQFNDYPQLMDSIKNTFNIYVSCLEEYEFEYDRCETFIREYFKVLNLDGVGLADYNLATIASGALLSYVLHTQKQNLSHINHIQFYTTSHFMILDMSSRRNLELVETMRGKERRGSLLWVLDKTKTAMGARKLRSRIEQPMVRISEINEQLDAIEELNNNSFVREEIKEYLNPIYDLERLMSKIICQTANPRDLIAFKQSISMLPNIRQIAGELNSQIYQLMARDLDVLEDLYRLIDDAILDEPAISLKEGGIIKSTYNEEVNELRKANTEGKNWLFDLEQKEKELTGIKNLKIKYNKVFGYYIEVTNSYKNLVPEDRYTRKQTLANAERFITPELKEMESTILNARDKVMDLEYKLYVEVRNYLARQVDRIKASAGMVAHIDMLQSLSEVSIKQNYVRPVVHDARVIEIKDGRHPVVEKMMADNMFIPNDTLLDNSGHRFSIITGPNMAGKSTYMRQVALITLMAQIGSFVPASSASIGVVDRIFTRVGASDDLASGQSTFMVEMTEVANILRNATKDSLIILDEIGRGTSTFDGLSIAWAVVEYLVSKTTIGAKALFATHYHELTELEGKIDGVVNHCISVKESGDDIIFLRKIIKGGADKSYGIQVARLAGVPSIVINRAKDLLTELTKADITNNVKNIAVVNDMEPVVQQMQLFNDDNHEVVDALKQLDINNMSPIEALNELDRLRKMVR